MATKIVHCKKEPYDVYIGRPGKWGNPFPVTIGREECVLKYKLWINTQPSLLKSLSELKNKTLGCFCKPLACHGDVLCELVDSKYVKNWFSNMTYLDKPFIYQGIEYKTVENFYQSMKLNKENLGNRKFISSLSPYRSKKEIRKFDLRSDWCDELKLKIMKYALRYKFRKGSYDRKLLDMTENWEIVEWNNWGDTFWGKDIKTEKGENYLGKLIMEIRDEQ